MKLCIVCNENEAGKYKIHRSTCCKECNDKDYMSSKEVSVILNISVYQASELIRDKRWDLFPEPDVRIGGWMYLWLRAKVKVFVDNQPTFDKATALKRYRSGMTIIKVAESLGVPKVYVHRYLKSIGATTKYKTYQHKRIRNNTEGVKFDHAMQLFNQCRINP